LEVLEKGGIGAINKISENMHFAVGDDGAHLNAGNDFDTQFGTDDGTFIDTRDSVMVDNTDDRQTHRLRPLKKLGRGEKSV
jgi:hypothetical protein